MSAPVQPKLGERIPTEQLVKLQPPLHRVVLVHRDHKPENKATPEAESLAYSYAGQVLRDTDRMGIQPHHAQQLADRIAEALVAFRVDPKLAGTAQEPRR